MQTYSDKTPIRLSATFDGGSGNPAINPFATVSGSTTVTVTHTGHGADDGSYVTFINSSDVNGVPAAELNTEHRITYVDANSYTITVTTTATGTGSGGGSTVVGEYQINPGQEIFSYTSGWGSGSWPTFVTDSLTNPFDTNSSSSTVTVNHTGHGLSTGDYVIFDAIGSPFLLSGGGLTSVGCDAVMLKAFQITVTGVNAYTISLDIGGKVYTPDATATGVGGAVTVLKKGGTTSTWGTTGIADLTEQLRLWIHDWNECYENRSAIHK
jgi:hypothetical protein